MNRTNPTILLVEDNEDDIFIMQRALKQGGIMNPLQIVTDGQMALDYLGGQGSYADRARFPFPFIVFLDLKLPRMHGFEVLSWIRQQPALNTLSIVVLTSSDEPKDHDNAQQLGLTSYVVKPPTPQVLKALFDSL